MGAWGYSLYENDSSCDVRDRFLRLLAGHSNKDTYEVFDFLKEAYADQMHDTDVVLSLANLAITFTQLTDELLEQALQAIEKEMTERLSSWREPEKREKFLLAFKNYLLVSKHGL